MMIITPLYAALLGLLYLWLSAQVILHRRKHLISLGDKGDKHLAQLIRAHANCAEYATIGVVLLAIAELQGAMPGAMIHGLGLMLLVGRVLHGYAFMKHPMIMPFRMYGMGLTLFMILFTALLMLVGFVL